MPVVSAVVPPIVGPCRIAAFVGSGKLDFPADSITCLHQGAGHVDCHCPPNIDATTPSSTNDVFYRRRMGLGGQW